MCSQGDRLLGIIESDYYRKEIESKKKWSILFVFE